MSIGTKVQDSSNLVRVVELAKETLNLTVETGIGELKIFNLVSSLVENFGLDKYPDKIFVTISSTSSNVSLEAKVKFPLIEGYDKMNEFLNPTNIYLGGFYIQRPIEEVVLSSLSSLTEDVTLVVTITAEVEVN